MSDATKIDLDEVGDVVEDVKSPKKVKEVKTEVIERRVENDVA